MEELRLNLDRRERRIELELVRLARERDLAEDWFGDVDGGIASFGWSVQGGMTCDCFVWGLTLRGLVLFPSYHGQVWGLVT